MQTADEAWLRTLLASRLRDIQQRMAAACGRAGRDPAEVTLVAVTKTAPVGLAALLPELGILDLGESRPQELWGKAAALPRKVRWHLIGHLQRNKIERSLPLIQLLHSVDTVRLLHALEEEAARQGRPPLPVLLEVNASREANKQGFAPAELPGLVHEIASLQHVHVVGLMTMAAWEEDPQQCRPTFAEVRLLRDKLRDQLGPPHDLRHLSMGMSNDYEIAIEEGATLVRVGTALFEGVA